jgi:hypothetical protein
VIAQNDLRFLRISIVAGQAADALTFALAVALLPELTARELNPLVAAAFALGGAALVFAMKVGVASIAAALIRPTTRPVYLWLVLAGALMGFVGAAFNSYAIIATR